MEAKSTLKRTLQRLAPTLFASVYAQRSRRHSERFEVRNGLSALSMETAKAFGQTVRAGPFAGLKYPASVLGRHCSPKLLGSYEAELHPFFNSMKSNPYSQIIDVGAAEGYYAVGLAQLFPASKVEAFDIDPWARRRVREMASLNGCQNVNIHGACTPQWLAQHLRPGALVFSDCEGYEATLLDPNSAPPLRESDIVVELHEPAAPGCTELISNWFSHTHTCELVGYDPSSRAAFLSPPVTDPRSVDEFRDLTQKWLIATRRRGERL